MNGRRHTTATPASAIPDQAEKRTAFGEIFDMEPVAHDARIYGMVLGFLVEELIVSNGPDGSTVLQHEHAEMLTFIAYRSQRAGSTVFEAWERAFDASRRETA
ncbi:hypothetical protein [Aureimonas sp. AU22]|uniref:hypothetical protein n=1 Tax=Aureimonas sp. AU22 TaxID=1638162 RepID=UPI000B0E9C60|nr:hypothetical protein [Aureimonas sp. AU22]